MSASTGWHLLVLSLMTVVPVLVVGGLVLVVIRSRRSARARSEERIAQRTARILRSDDGPGR